MTQTNIFKEFVQSPGTNDLLSILLKYVGLSLGNSVILYFLLRCGTSFSTLMTGSLIDKALKARLFTAESEKISSLITQELVKVHQTVVSQFFLGVAQIVILLSLLFMSIDTLFDYPVPLILVIASIIIGILIIFGFLNAKIGNMARMQQSKLQSLSFDLRKNSKFFEINNSFVWRSDVQKMYGKVYYLLSLMPYVNQSSKNILDITFFSLLLYLADSADRSAILMMVYFGARVAPNLQGAIAFVNNLNVNSSTLRYCYKLFRMIPLGYHVTDSCITDCERIDTLVEKSRFIEIKGKSGSGKSTLINHYGLISSDLDVLFVPQHLESLIYFNFAKLLPARSHDEELLVRLGIPISVSDLYCHELLERLSGGEKKRLIIYYILISNQRIVVADEVFAGIDAETLKSVEGIFLEYFSLSRVFIYSSHADVFKGQADKNYVYLAH